MASTAIQRRGIGSQTADFVPVGANGPTKPIAGYDALRGFNFRIKLRKRTLRSIGQQRADEIYYS